jgi:D-alanyl-D-alanine carboxypeptidase
MKPLKLLLLLGCFILFNPFLSTAQHQVDTEKLDKFFSSLEKNDRFMGAIYLRIGDQEVFNRAYGMADDKGAEASESSIYRVGSISKTYTAVLTLKLAEMQKLSLDDTLDQFYPSIPNASVITIRNLLQHTSGLENFTNRADYMTYHTEGKSKNDMLEMFEGLSISFEPGECQEYSNSGYVLLGYIIEEVTGQSYNDALLAYISDPLGLEHTYFGMPASRERNEVNSFTYDGGSWVQSEETDMSIPHGAGAVVSTAEETARFYQKLLNGEILTEASLDEMKALKGAFGLGLLRFPFYDKFAWGHNGGIDGFQSSSAVFMEDDIAYAILGNAVNYNFNEILIGFLNIVYGKEYDIPDFAIRESVTLSDDQLKLYTGTYSSASFPMQIRIFVQNGQLMGQASGQGAFPLTSLDEYTFIFEQAGLELIFEPKKGEIFQEFTLNQSGMSFPFSRVE